MAKMSIKMYVEEHKSLKEINDYFRSNINNLNLNSDQMKLVKAS